MVDLSIIIISYNTAKITKNCLQSVISSINNQPLAIEIIVVDNHSTDDTKTQIAKLKAQNPNLNLKTIFNSKNLGFAKANNQAAKIAQGKYLLFLNSDVIVNRINFVKLIDFFNQDNKVGVLTVKVIRPDGQLDPACHRGFPTLWRSFCYLIGLEKIFGSLPLINRIFGGYHLTFLDLKVIHEIDSPSGAFYLIKKSLFKRVGGFDEKFFMYGEDLDLSFRIKQLGYKVIYFPFEQVTHLKYQSGIAAKNNERKSKIKNHFYQAMKIFYKKHYAQSYPSFFNRFIYFLIDYEKNRH